MFNTIHRGILTLMLLTAGLLLGNASYAALAFPTPLLNPTFVNPDIVGTVLQISYDYKDGTANNLLGITQSANSTGTYKDKNNVSHTIDGLTYTLNAVLDYLNNNALVSGTLTITGGISDVDFSIPNGSTLLTANLTALGTNYNTQKGSQSGTFDFLGNVTGFYNGTGGNLEFGPRLAVVYSTQTITEFQALADFTSSSGSADNATEVPEPGTLILLAAGGLALCGVRRQRPTMMAD